MGLKRGGPLSTTICFPCECDLLSSEWLTFPNCPYDILESGSQPHGLAPFELQMRWRACPSLTATHPQPPCRPRPLRSTRAARRFHLPPWCAAVGTPSTRACTPRDHRLGTSTAPVYPPHLSPPTLPPFPAKQQCCWRGMRATVLISHVKLHLRDRFSP